MSQNEVDVLILKPTSAFLSFLSAQIADIDLPDIGTLQTDSTAYTIPRQYNDEETLNEIERNYSVMFDHEIARVLGTHHSYDVEGTFLDFLCCFKFELHSQIVFMESASNEGQQLLCVKPKSVLLKWMKSSLRDQDEFSPILKQLSLSHLTDNTTVLVKKFQNISDVKPFIKHYYRPIFKAEMLRIHDDTTQWPEVDSYQTFSRYFAVEVHTQLVHLH